MRLLAVAFAATVAVLAFAAYRTATRIVPACAYVEPLGAAVDAVDAPLVARHESDTPRLSGVIDLGPLAVGWESAYLGHSTSTGDANAIGVGPRSGSCHGPLLSEPILPRPGTPNLDFELYHREGSNVYRVVALDRRGVGQGDRYEAGHLAMKLGQRPATRRFSFLHVLALASFVVAGFGAFASRRPLRDALEARRRKPGALSAGVFRTSGREADGMALEDRMLLRTMHRDRQRALVPLVVSMLLAVVALLGTLLPAG